MILSLSANVCHPHLEVFLLQLQELCSFDSALKFLVVIDFLKFWEMEHQVSNIKILVHNAFFLELLDH